MALKISREISVYVGIFVAGLIALPALVLICGFAGALPFNASDAPPQWEQSLGQNFLRASVSAQAAGLVDPIDPKNETDMSAGLHHFRAGCAGCHGDYGKPSEWGTTAFYPRVPQFAERHPPLTAAQMFVVVKNGVRYTGMAANPDSPGASAAEIAANNRAIWQMVTFIDHMRDLPAGVDAVWKRPRHH